MEGLPPAIKRGVENAIESLPAAIQSRVLESIEASAAVHPHPVIPASKASLVILPAPVTPPILENSPGALSALSPLPQEMAVREDLLEMESDDESIPSPTAPVVPVTLPDPALAAVASGPRNNPVVEQDEDPAVPSIVANRTQTKTKVASNPADDKNDAAAASDQGDVDVGNPSRPKKCKATTPDNDDEDQDLGTHKRSKMTAKAKAPPRKSKTAGKKKV